MDSNNSFDLNIGCINSKTIKLFLQYAKFYIDKKQTDAKFEYNNTDKQIIDVLANIILMNIEEREMEQGMTSSDSEDSTDYSDK